MARNRGNAYGAPPEEKEVVVTVDRRLLLGGGAAVLVVAALVAGIWFSRYRQPGAVATGTGAGVAQLSSAQATQQMQSEMMTAQVPLGAQVIAPNFATLAPDELPPPVATAPPAGGVDGDNPYILVGGTPTFQSPAQATQLHDVPGTKLEFKEGRPDASQWSHDVLANFEDPNVTKKEYLVAHPEAMTEPAKGPRLGVKELNLVNTFDYGKIPMTISASHDFTMVNVGDEDLIVSRIYTGCGCTATRFGDVFLDNAGFLPKPMTLKPGQEQVFTIEFDPRSEGKPGAQSKFMQIFSNDTTKTQFTPGDPLSHETRFRIVVEPAYDVKTPEGAKVYKVTKAGGENG